MKKQMLKQTIERLRQDGVRITPQRIAILEYLASVETHPTAEEIYHEIVDYFPQISVATVYNNLNLFTKSGIIQELTHGDDASRYDFDEGRHYHAVCEKCGRIVDLYYPILDDVEMVAEQLTGFQITGHRMEVYGLCPQCQNK